MVSDSGLPAEQQRSEIRASDADREAVADVLRDALVEGRLQLTEFESRLEEAHAARTHGELEQIVHDLPVVSAAGSPVVAASPAAGAPPASRRAVGILGGFDKKGIWTIAREFTSVAVMGGGRIDLREARFEAPETVIRCYAVMGGLNVILPPEVEVDVRGVGIMGGFESKSAVGAPGAPRVVITGVAFWGGVTIERKVTKAERKRLKAERRERKQLDKTQPEVQE